MKAHELQQQQATVGDTRVSQEQETEATICKTGQQKIGKTLTIKPIDY